MSSVELYGRIKPPSGAAGFGIPNKPIPGTGSGKLACDHVQNQWLRLGSGAPRDPNNPGVGYRVRVGPDLGAFPRHGDSLNPINSVQIRSYLTSLLSDYQQNALNQSGSWQGFSDCDSTRSDCVTNGWLLDREAGLLAIATPNFEEDANDSQGCGAGCSTCAAGQSNSAHNGSVEFMIPVGTDADNRGTNYIELRGESITPGLALLSKQMYKVGPGMSVAYGPADEAGEPLFVKITGSTVVALGRTIYPLRAPEDVGESPLPAAAGSMTYGVRWDMYLRSEYDAAGTNAIPYSSTTVRYMPCAPESLQDFYTAALAVEQLPASASAHVLAIETAGAGNGRWIFRQIGTSFELLSGVNESWDSALRVERKTRRSVARPTQPQPPASQLPDDILVEKNFFGPVYNGVIGDTLVAREVELHRHFAWGTRVVERRRGLDSNALIERFTYSEDAPPPDENGDVAFGANGYGKLKSYTSPTGHWQTYEYDTAGNLIKHVKQIGCQPPTSGAVNNSSTEYRVLFLQLNNGDSELDTVYEAVEKYNNVPVARSYRVMWSVTAGVNPTDPVSYTDPLVTGNPAAVTQPVRKQVEWKVRCYDPTPTTDPATFLNSLIGHETDGSKQDLITVTVREADEPFRVIGTRGPDGHLTITRYQQLTDGAKAITTTTGPSNADGSWVRGGSQTYQVTNRSGTLVLERVYDLQYPVQPQLISERYSDPGDLDRFGRALAVHERVGAGPIQTSRTVYNCCGVEERVDTGGVRTRYEYDALGRVVSTWRQVGFTPSSVAPLLIDTDGDGQPDSLNPNQPIPTGGFHWLRENVVLDPLGNVIRVNTVDDLNGEISTEQTIYDPAGEPIWQTDGPIVYHTQTTTAGCNVVRTTDPLIRPAAVGDQSSPSCATVRTVEISDPDGNPVSRVESAGDTCTSGMPARIMTWSRGVEESVSISSPIAYTFPHPLRFQKVAVGSDQREWTKTYTNALGQKVLTTDSAGNARVWIYDNRGRVQREIDPDGLQRMHFSGYGVEDRDTQDALVGAAAITGVDWFGAWSIECTPAAAPNQTAASPTAPVNFGGHDRITMSLRRTATRDGTIPVRRTMNWVWPLEPTGAAGESVEPELISQTDTTLDGNFTWTTRLGETSTTEITRQLNGVEATKECSPDGACRQSVSAYGRHVATRVEAPDASLLSAVLTTYDAQGRIDRIDSSASGQHSTTTTRTYDNWGNLQTETRSVTARAGVAGPVPAPETTAFGYDLMRRVIVTTRMSDPPKSTFVEYYPSGDVKETHGFGVNPVEYTYDDRGRIRSLTTFTGPSGAGAAVTRWLHNRDTGRLEAKWYNGAIDNDTPNDTAITYTYTPAGRLKTRRWARSVITQYTYDEFGDVTGIGYSDGTPSVTKIYDRLGRVVATQDAAGARIIEHAANGVPSDESIAEGTPATIWALADVSVRNTFDAWRQVEHRAQSRSGHVNAVQFEYDQWRRISRVSKLPFVVDYSYNPAGGALTNVRYAVRSEGNDLPVLHGRRTFDGFGRLSEFAWGQADANGSLTSPLQDRYAYAYDALGRRNQMQFVDGSNWSFGYDNLNQLTSADRTFASGVHIPGYNYRYNFDLIGNRTSIEFGGDTAREGRDLSTYSPNVLNQYSSRVHPGAVYVVNQPIESKDAAFVQQGSDPLQLMNKLDATNGGPVTPMFWKRLTVDNTTAPVLQDVTIQEIPGGDLNTLLNYVPARNESFAYDLDGNLTADGVWRYEWDGENRLIAMQLQNAAAEALFPLVNVEGALVARTHLRVEFGYDHAGRRIGKRVLRGTQQFDPSNPDPAALSTVQSAVGLGGSVISPGTGGLTPTPPTPAPLAVGVDFPLPGQPGITWRVLDWKKYVYDILGSSGQWNLSLSLNCDALGQILEDATGKDMSYAWGPDLSNTLGGAGGIGGLAIVSDDAKVFTNAGPDAPASGPINALNGALSFPVYDGNGNVMRLWGSAGSNAADVTSYGPVAKYNYGPFGEPLGMNGTMAARNPFRFSTKFTDNESGLVYYGYRYYSPNLGRWISRDPIGELDTKNLFASVRNSPSMTLDYLGLSCLQRCKTESCTSFNTGAPQEPSVRPGGGSVSFDHACAKRCMAMCARGAAPRAASEITCRPCNAAIGELSWGPFFSQPGSSGFVIRGNVRGEAPGCCTSLGIVQFFRRKVGLNFWGRWRIDDGTFGGSDPSPTPPLYDVPSSFDDRGAAFFQLADAPSQALADVKWEFRILAFCLEGPLTGHRYGMYSWSVSTGGFGQVFTSPTGRVGGQVPTPFDN